MFSISYVPAGGDFAGQDCAFWKSYGEPHKFDSYEQAASFVREQPPCWRHLDMKVISLRVALELSAEMVEVYSDRRKVEGYRRVVVNEAKADYARVMSVLVRPVVRIVKRRPVIERISSGNFEPCASFTAD